MAITYRLFVVDGVEASRRIVQPAFGDRYQIEAFDSGAACIARMAEEFPDIYLLDVDMPEMDGHTLCRFIRSEAASSAAPGRL